jgi:hypothetical protein
MQTNQSKIEYVKDTFPEYLGKKEYLSSSDIKSFLKSPKMFYYKKYEEQRKEEPERHFSIGSALHEMVLEPELFNQNYIIAPKFDKRTKEGKAGYEEFLKTSQGKTVLFEDEMEMIQKMAENAMNNETLTELIKDSYRELSIYTVDEKTGLKIRLRPDSFSNNKSTMTDIKTCLDSSPKKFKGDVYSYGYSISAAYYMDFANKENYVFAAMEKQAPYQVSLYVLDDDMVEYGRQQYRMALDLLKWSFDNKYWCDYNEFEILKECYELGNLHEFMDIKNKSNRITILK